jgi:hypothetical protein
MFFARLSTVRDAQIDEGTLTLLNMHVSIPYFMSISEKLSWIDKLEIDEVTIDNLLLASTSSITEVTYH